jgi:hypothetical protein
MDEETWQNVMKRLKYQLQGLAMPADVQLQLLPDFVCKADELAIDYGHWCLVVLDNDEGQLTEHQRFLLTRLDEFFERMSKKKVLWTDEALKTRSEWSSVRTMAEELLNAFEWPIEKPAEPI